MIDDPDMPRSKQSLSARALLAAREHGDVEKFIRDLKKALAEPWREYFPYRPDDMPKSKDSRVLLRLKGQQLRGEL